MDFKFGLLLVIGAQLCLSAQLSPCACTKELNPVCGSDGQTYNNPCLLRCAVHTTGKDITIVKLGPCEETEDKPELKRHTRAPCICTYDYKPVCGTDGKTYGNECALNCEAKTNKSLKLKHGGACNN